MPDQIGEPNAIALGMALCMSVLIIALPRRLAIIPIAAITCCLTLGQAINVASLHFTMLRVVVLAGCLRILFRQEFRSIKWVRLDTVMILWILSGTIAYSLLWQTQAAVINRLGIAYDAWGLYFFFRAVLKEPADIVRASKIFAYLLVPVALSMIHERLTSKNLFYVFGGVPEYPTIRDGVIRCQGPFGHPILAGSFGAAWIPMFVGLWRQKNGNRLAAVLGFLSATAITGVSGSSGPLMAYMAGLIACTATPLRRSLRLIRWAAVAAVAVLALVMKDPVWFIFARINIFSASTGWHRSNLIDQTIKHFSDWCFVGVKTVEPWGVWWGDITNHFIFEGVRGGLVTGILFLASVVVAFSTIGRIFSRITNQPKRDQILVWALGSTIFAHTVAFLDVAYTDQNIANWYLTLASVAALLNFYSRVQLPTSRKTSVPKNNDCIAVLDSAYVKHLPQTNTAW
jgi:hypothetical protein